MADFTLLIQPGVHPCFPKLCLFRRVIGIVSLKDCDLATVDLDDLRGDPIQEVTVVGYHQNSAVVV